ncbi:LpxI family protein [Roseobacter sp. HKCCA0434]|uniref:LpxI family protein n=1 Tax=Roseobacter sp. HKCCA0434 TaxID=3079297 RepID=UPI002905A6FF|nr:UDP-2,3-diacylglucosamine diphosphatase LpxI [Roseobacter sp. HKCCA0434]
MSALGIVAGRGSLPRRIAERMREAGTPYQVVALDGFAGDWVSDHPHERLPITAVGRLLATLRAAGCDRIVLAGGVERPRINPLTLDRHALRWMMRIAPALRRGDDGLLRTVRALLEGEGFALVPVTEVMPDLTEPPGLLTRAGPTRAQERDIARGTALLRDLAPLDIGQGVVIAEAQVLAVETLPGTDAMLRFVGRERPGSGGVLVKRLKEAQDRHVDLPTIGPDTVEGAVAAGLSGIAIEAHGVLVLDRDAVIARADAAGLFVKVIR